MNEFRRCRFCGRVVLFNDARRLAAHEGPPCEGWKKLLAQMVNAGLMRELPPEVHEVPDDLPRSFDATGRTTFCPVVGEPDGRKKKDD